MTKLKIDDKILETELKDGFVLYQYPLENGLIKYTLSFIASKSFTMSSDEVRFSGTDMINNHVNYMIKVCEHHVADLIRTAVFRFKEKGHSRKLLGMNMKISDKCPDGHCIINPKDYHELMEKYYTNPRGNEIISD